MTTASSVLLIVHAPTVPIVSERRLPADVPLSNVQGRLELLCGIPPDAQRLSLWTARTDDAGSRAAAISRMDDSHTSTTLVQLGARDGMGLLVEDTRGARERDRFSIEEEEKVQKFELDDDAYAQRQDTVLAYKQRHKMGRFNDAQPAVLTSSDDLSSALQIGVRCEVEGGRRGTIRYFGETEFAKGSWVGVEYDEPVGKNDGSVTDKQYFSCAAKHGGFVKSEKVRLGEYPIRSIEDDPADGNEEM